MAVQRVWFVNAPVSGISAADRAQLGIGYGGIILIAAGGWTTIGESSGTWVTSGESSGTWTGQGESSGTWVDQGEAS